MSGHSERIKPSYRYDSELCAEQKLDMRGLFEVAKLRHAALGLLIQETAPTSGGWNLAQLMAIHDGQAEILAMWKEALNV